MQSKFSFYAHQLQGGASFGHTIDRNCAKMRRPKAANRFFSLKLSEKVAHLCAVFPNGMPKASPLAFPTEECETNQEPLIMSVSLDRNKRVSCKIPLMMSGLGSLRSAKQSESSERSGLITNELITGRVDIRPVLRYQYLAGGSL